MVAAAAAAAGAAKTGGSAAGRALKYLSLFPIAYLSLLAGASIVHNIYQPDLVRACVRVRGFVCLAFAPRSALLRLHTGLETHA